VSKCSKRQVSLVAELLAGRLIYGDEVLHVYEVRAMAEDVNIQE
jgi:hypothetical protein